MANELWQLDGIAWRLADDTEVTIYQIVDDCTRLITALTACVGGERSQDAVMVVEAATGMHGIPAAVLTDNGSAFNQHRRGKTTELEVWLAQRGSRPISGRVAHPQTQGKTERAHQPVQKWLNARCEVATVEELNTLLAEFTIGYNHRRQHQGLGVRVTPMMAWASVAKATPLDHPIDLADLYGKQPLSLPPTSSRPTLASKAVKANGRLSHRGVVLYFSSRYAGQEMHFINTDDQVEIFDTAGELFATIPWPPPRASREATVSLKPGSPYLNPRPVPNATTS